MIVLKFEITRSARFRLLGYSVNTINERSEMQEGYSEGKEATSAATAIRSSPAVHRATVRPVKPTNVPEWKASGNALIDTAGVQGFPEETFRGAI